MIENIKDIPRTFCDDLVVTPKLAHSILTDGHLREVHPKPINQSKVKALRDLIKAGEFKDNTPLIFCVLKNKLYLANGRHRLTACLQLKHTATFTAVIVPVESRKSIDDQIYRITAELNLAEDNLPILPGNGALSEAMSHI